MDQEFISIWHINPGDLFLVDLWYDNYSMHGICMYALRKDHLFP